MRMTNELVCLTFAILFVRRLRAQRQPQQMEIISQNYAFLPFVELAKDRVRR